MICKNTRTVLKVRSPLRYPGGKSRAAETILALLPDGITDLCSPFVGGGSVELAAASIKGIRVHAYDAFPPLVTFWQCALSDPIKLANKVRHYYPLRKSEFYSLQQSFGDWLDTWEIAASFFILNRASYSGTTLSGGMSRGHPRFTDSCIDRLRDFKVDNFWVETADFKHSICKHPNDFLYLDPPYMINGALYGNRGDQHTNFDHEGLAKLLKERDGWLLSYNDCEKVRGLYKGYTITAPEWAYGMSKDKNSKEVLISPP